jgi:hypothetical protein
VVIVRVLDAGKGLLWRYVLNRRAIAGIESAESRKNLWWVIDEDILLGGALGSRDGK